MATVGSMKRLLILFSVALLLGACASHTVLLDSTPTESVPPVRTFDQHGLSFQYPGAWLVLQTGSGAGEGTGEGTGASPPTVQPQQQSVDVVGLDELNNVRIAYGVSDVSGGSFASWSAQERQTLAELVAAHKEQLLSPPEEITVAGLRALRYTVRRATGLGYNIDVTLVGFVRGTTQFLITCTHLPDRITEIQPGCQQVLDTLHIG